MIAFILFAPAVLAFGSAYMHWRRMPGLMPGKLIYSDTDRHDLPVLVSHRYGLVGKPDYAYRRRGITTPVEVKTKIIGRYYARAWDIAQLMTYAVLLEDNGATVREGILEYPDHKFDVLFDAAQKRMVLERVERIRRQRAAGTADRDHSDAWRCRACGVRERCDQALAGDSTH